VKLNPCAPYRLIDARALAAKVLEHVFEDAKRRKYERVSLETGSMDAFAPAHHLNAKFGFKRCGPFAGYVEDPNSVFMTIELKVFVSISPT
jgi:putative acetyltransferase